MQAPDMSVPATTGASRVPPPAALALSPHEFRRLGHQVIDMVADYLDQLPERPVFQPMPEPARRAVMTQALPQEPTPPDDVLTFLATHIMPFPMGNGHPRFFGWVNAPPAPFAVLTDLIATAMNPSCAGGDHAAIYLERCVVRWLMELVGFPTTGSFGLLVSGGSMASLTGLTAARHWAAQADGWNVRSEGVQGQRPPFTLYMSEEGHSCVRKAAELLGIGGKYVRMIPTDAHFRMNLTALRHAVQADRGAGQRPFCVVASAGTVNTGAVDPLSALAEFCAEEGLWLHVDGAYGAVGCLDPATAGLFDGLGQADSLALDPHKWLSVPVECGCVLVRHGTVLREAFSLVPPYLRTEEGHGFGGLPWYSEYGFQQSRGFRALKLWTVLQHAGRTGVTALVRRHNALAARLTSAIEAAADVELMAPVSLSVVCFRYVPPDQTLAPPALDTLNTRLAEVVQACGEVFLTRTTIKERVCLRANILHFGTSEADIDFLVHTVRTTGAELVRGRATSAGTICPP